MTPARTKIAPLDHIYELSTEEVGWWPLSSEEDGMTPDDSEDIEQYPEDQ